MSRFHFLPQFGCHYNALHVAAMKNQPAICRLILETLEDVGYVKMLYPDESPVTDQQCIDFVVDLYLNTPDKGVGVVAREPFEFKVHVATSRFC